MARHVASHLVTVPECDTVLRASRHIRPPIRGGVYVTRDLEARKGEFKYQTTHSEAEA